MQGRRFGVGACAIAVAIAIGACGGDENEASGDGADPSAEFTARADGLCTESQRERVTLAAEFQLAPEGASEEEVFAAEAEREAALLEVREDLGAELAALEPPDELGAEWDEYLALLDEARTVNAEAVAAVEAVDAKESGRLFDEVAALNAEAQAVAEGIGLEACAQVLPPEDVEEVEAVIELLEVTDDPARICAEAFTRAAIESQFGTTEDCEAAQEQLEPADFADSVEFETDVTGVEGVYARVEATPVGGQYDGQTSGYNVFFEDGAYRVGEVVEAEGG